MEKIGGLMDLSIIIVNYNTFQLTTNVIESILNQNTSYEYEILVVDNDSSDDSFKKLKSRFSSENLINFISSQDNNGFARANNMAIKKASGNYILLLNSDTIVKGNTLENSIDYISSHSDVGALGVKVLLEDGQLDKACKRSFPNPVNSFYKLFHIPTKNNNLNNYNLTTLDDNGVYEIDCLTGAFILFKRELISTVGLLDESFFMYGEDIDFCYRIKKRGWKIIYYGKEEIIHFKGGSSKKEKFKLIYHFYKSMYIFYNKHYKEKYSVFLNLLVYLGISILCIFKLVLNLFKS